MMKIPYIHRAGKCKKIRPFLDCIRSAGLAEQFPGYQTLDTFLNQTTSCFKENFQSVYLKNSNSHILDSDQLLLCGPIGLAGSVYLAEYQREHLLSFFSESFLDQTGLLRELYSPSYCMKMLPVLKKYPLREIFIVSEGGLYQQLFSLAKNSGLGFYVSLENIPIKQETIELCEVLKLHPYQLLSGGCFLFVLPPDSNSHRLAEELSSQGYSAAVIGHMTKERSMILTYHREERLLNHPKPDEILKILVTVQKQPL